MSRFITIEGPEGSGKTTQIRLLRAALEAQGVTVVATREPGGTEIGNAVRAIVLNQRHNNMSPRAEALLFNAARAQLVDEVIQPALAAGSVVLCDRYADSTLAYQGYGNDMPLEPLRQLAAYATAGLQPHLTIYLDIDVQAGLKRKQDGAVEEWNRMEEKTLAYHETVRRGYLTLAADEPQRWLRVDATQPIEAVHQAILGRVLPLILPQSA